MVTQSTHLSKDCYPQLVLNPQRSEIQPTKQLDYRCMPLHLAPRKIICACIIELDTTVELRIKYYCKINYFTTKYYYWNTNKVVAVFHNSKKSLAKLVDRNDVHNVKCHMHLSRCGFLLQLIENRKRHLFFL